VEFFDWINTFEGFEKCQLELNNDFDLSVLGEAIESSGDE
jgi:hypothetical protein